VRFLFDHDVPDDLSHVLRQAGHDVILLRDVLPANANDPVVLAHASVAARILVTCNRDDFVQLAASAPHAGIVVLFRRKTRAAERAALVRLIAQAGEAGLRHNLTFA